MLYDQAAFLRVLSKWALCSSSPLVQDALEKTLKYLSTEMLSSEGYFFASQDADSEGEEGIYFTYTKKEFELVAKRALAFAKGPSVPLETLLSWFQVTEEGNFRDGLNVISLDGNQKKEFLRGFQLGFDFEGSLRASRLSPEENSPFNGSKGGGFLEFSDDFGFGGCGAIHSVWRGTGTCSKSFSSGASGALPEFFLKTNPSFATPPLLMKSLFTWRITAICLRLN